MKEMVKTMAYIICFDTLCTGFEAMKENDKIMLFENENQAVIELESDPEFYEDCFIAEENEIGHKSIYNKKEEK